MDPRDRLHRLPTRWSAAPTRRRMDDSGRFTDETAGQRALRLRKRHLDRFRQGSPLPPDGASSLGTPSVITAASTARPGGGSVRPPSAASVFSFSSRPPSRSGAHFQTTLADEASMSSLDETSFASANGDSPAGRRPSRPHPSRMSPGGSAPHFAADLRTVREARPVPRRAGAGGPGGGRAVLRQTHVPGAPTERRIVAPGLRPPSLTSPVRSDGEDAGLGRSGGFTPMAGRRSGPASAFGSRAHAPSGGRALSFGGGKEEDGDDEAEEAPAWKGAAAAGGGGRNAWAQVGAAPAPASPRAGGASRPGDVAPVTSFEEDELAGAHGALDAGLPGARAAAEARLGVMTAARMATADHGPARTAAEAEASLARPPSRGRVGAASPSLLAQRQSRPVTAGSEPGSLFTSTPWSSRPPSRGADPASPGSFPAAAGRPPAASSSTLPLLSEYAWPATPLGYSSRPAASLASSVPVRAPTPQRRARPLPDVDPPRFAGDTEQSTIRAAETARDRGDSPLADSILASALRGDQHSGSAFHGPREPGPGREPAAASVRPRPRTAAPRPAALRPNGRTVSLQQYLASGARPVPRTTRAAGASPLFPFANASAAARLPAVGAARAATNAQVPLPAARAGARPRSKRMWSASSTGRPRSGKAGRSPSPPRTARR